MQGKKQRARGGWREACFGFEMVSDGGESGLDASRRNSSGVGGNEALRRGVMGN